MIAEIIIVALASWRVASLLVNEDGPYNVFGRLREAVGIRPRSELTELAKVFACVWCITVWLVPVFWLAYLLAWWIPGLFAAMAAAIIIERWVRP